MTFVAVTQDQAVGAQFFFSVHTVGGLERGIPGNRASGAGTVTIFPLGQGKIEALKKFFELRVNTLWVFYKILV